ncbi:tRNA pseudouridine(55) synthase TruB [Candidatus Beckwithbacteria bacterium]|nr:tRNA pseudouridine(55) synthase TruB [Candidatus Beckwithbacteria bacterium]
MDYIFPIYKPKGPTSHDIISQIRKTLNLKKVGHAGTLDPLASGVLVMGITRAGTKQINYYLKQEKEYEAEIFLGQYSSTDDSEGEKTKVDFKIEPSKKEIQQVLQNFIGEIEQTPPIFSAIKIQGKPAYKYARKGQTLELKPRKVLIKKIILLSYSFPILKIKVVCGSGVYIRSLARDIGKSLQTGAFLQELIRTRVGNFKLENCLKVSDLRFTLFY